MAEDNEFAVSVVTPERILLEGTASEVVLRTAEGDSTYLAGHSDLVGAVEPGVLRVAGSGVEGGELRIALHGGFVQVESSPPVADEADVGEAAVLSRGRVTVLAGVAELAAEVDVERARAAFERAEARTSELESERRTGGGEGEEPAAGELAEARAALRRAQVRLDAAGSAEHA
ncbi:MAG: hypothetical protein M0029_02000 [Actinomycetota bacterium]|jgi:F-type H+-transporting ATPase subunit epsilon|nr:hypothetical protein [Actinomycetota bacterium]